MDRKIMKTLLALLLVIQLVVASAIPVVANAVEVDEYISTEDVVEELVATTSIPIAATNAGVAIRPVPTRNNRAMGDWIAAIAESQVQTEQAIGGRNPYSLAVRNRDGHAWCGDFVAWVYAQAGFGNYVVHSYNSGIPRAGIGGWNFSSSQNWRNIDDNSPFVRVTGNPQTGDFAVWQDGTNWTGHISIITDVNVASNTVTFVSGNWSNSVRRRTVTNIANPLGQQPAVRVFRGYFRIRSIEETPQLPEPPIGNYFPRYTGNSTSIIIALDSLGIDSSFAHRTEIANANGITNFTGTADQNTMMLNLLINGILRRPNDTVTNYTNYFPRYTGNSTSIVDALNVLDIDSSFVHRTEIANANGITNFTGTASQNAMMLNLLINGTLRRP